MMISALFRRCQPEAWRSRGARAPRPARRLAVSLTLSLTLFPAAAGAAPPEQVDVFESGKDGYAFFRIPAVVVAGDGSVLAFCEGRRHDRRDHGDIDLVLRRSSDGGKTWGPLQTVWDDGANTCGNPAPVLDRRTGRVWLFTTWNLGTDTERMIMDGVSTDTRRVYLTYSDDHGATWAPPAELTSSAKHADWRWYATGPGHGIQLSGGRLVVPGNHSCHSGLGHPYRTHVIVSDDAGRTWRLGATVGEKINESTVAELSDGRLCINMRSYHEANRRAVAFSTTGGDSWDGVALDQALVEPVCQASLLRHTAPGGRLLHLFSNPASTKRGRLTVRVSRDDCRTWNDGRLLHEGPAAYSDLCSLAPETIGCLYERDLHGKAYGRITFARLELDWLTGADTSPSAQTGPEGDKQ